MSFAKFAPRLSAEQRARHLNTLVAANCLKGKEGVVFKAAHIGRGGYVFEQHQALPSHMTLAARTRLSDTGVTVIQHQPSGRIDRAFHRTAPDTSPMPDREKAAFMEAVEDIQHLRDLEEEDKISDIRRAKGYIPDHQMNPGLDDRDTVGESPSFDRAVYVTRGQGGKYVQRTAMQIEENQDIVETADDLGLADDNANPDRDDR